MANDIIGIKQDHYVGKNVVTGGGGFSGSGTTVSASFNIAALTPDYAKLTAANFVCGITWCSTSTAVSGNSGLTYQVGYNPGNGILTITLTNNGTMQLWITGGGVAFTCIW